MSHLRVVVGVPSGTTWTAEFGLCLANMVGLFGVKQVQGWKSQELRIVNSRGSMLPTQRLEILKKAKEFQATHLLFIDSDQTFPSDLAHKLLHWQQDVVAANCVTKQIPANPTARGFDANNPKGRIVYTDPESSGLEQVWRIGTGVMLLSAKAFNLIPHSAFEMIYKPDVDAYQGEDWTMCQTFDDAGIPIMIDHDVSKQVGHVGTLTYVHDYVGTK